MDSSSDPTAWLNGRLVPLSEAALSVSDAGLLHGASAFTTMRAHRGVVFRLGRHLERLLGTVQALGLRTDADEPALRGAVAQTLAANGLAEARVRVTLTPGSVRDDAPTTLVTAEALPDYPRAWYERGISAVVTDMPQPTAGPTAGRKTGCYLPRVLGRQQAAAAGADEALWFTADKRLAEACFCNVFLVAGGTVRTPPLATPVLDGIVRHAVLELCDELHLPADADSPLTVQDMLAAEEAFLTASCSGVRPLVRIERHAVGDERPGPITRRLLGAYEELLDRECAAAAARKED